MDDTISLHELRAFAAIARHGSLSRAATACGVQRAAMSKLLAGLEERCGVRLVERSTRRMSLTAAGQVLAERAEEMLQLSARALEDVRREAHEPKGLLRVAAPPELGTWLTSRVMAPFVARHPTIHLTLRLDYAFADVLDTAIDLAIRVGQVQHQSLVARKVGSFTRILVASPTVARRMPEDVVGLEVLPCVLFGDGEAASTWTLTDGMRIVRVRASGRFSARSFPALLQAAVAGVGIAQLPDFVAEPYLATGVIVRVLPAWRSPLLDVLAVHRPGHHRVRRVAALLDALDRDLIVSS